MRPSCSCAFFLFALVLALISPPGAASATTLRPWPGAQAQPAAQPQPAAGAQNAPQDQQEPPGYAIAVTVPIVNVDVSVSDENGTYVSGLTKENFRLSEDGMPQTITNFSTADAPITVVLVLEYSRLGYYSYAINAENWGNAFLRQLKPTDWVALESFNLHTDVEVDFTHNPADIQQGLVMMNYPPFSESNLFDAIGDTIDRLADVKGRKSMLVFASGKDTFSKLTLDKILSRLKESDVMINCIGVGQYLSNFQNGGGAVLDYAQSQNQLRTFAAMTGGRAFFPTFDGEIPGLMSQIAGSLRNEYSLAFMPGAHANDGKYHKIKVELVNEDGSPFSESDSKGKKKKFTVYARQGYTAAKPESGN